MVDKHWDFINNVFSVLCIWTEKEIVESLMIQSLDRRLLKKNHNNS